MTSRSHHHDAAAGYTNESIAVHNDDDAEEVPIPRSPHSTNSPTEHALLIAVERQNQPWAASDSLEELARLAETSHPRVKLDTSGLSPAATELANVLAENIEKLDEAELRRITASIRAALGRT